MFFSLAVQLWLLYTRMRFIRSFVSIINPYALTHCRMDRQIEWMAEAVRFYEITFSSRCGLYRTQFYWGFVVESKGKKKMNSMVHKNHSIKMRLIGFACAKFIFSGFSFKQFANTKRLIDTIFFLLTFLFRFRSSKKRLLTKTND